MVADFNKKQKSEVSANKIAFQIAGVLFCIVILALIFANLKMYEKKKELTLQINNYKKQIQSLNKNSQTLKDEIANSDNADYLEKIAYEQLNQQKPGEKEVIFISPAQKAEISQKSENSWPAWLSGAWNWLKSRF